MKLTYANNTQEQYRISLEHTAPINDELAYRLAVAHEDNQSFRDHVSSESLVLFTTAHMENFRPNTTRL